MNILITTKCKLPVSHYGGTQRDICAESKELSRLGHKVTLLAAPGSYDEFADVIDHDISRPITEQIPDGFDVIHFHDGHYLPKDFKIPNITTIHGKPSDPNIKMDINTVFISRDHASRSGADAYVYNGLDWELYEAPDLTLKREYFHFLGKAAWRKKNVKGAIKISRMAGENLKILGGHRLNFKMGFRFTPYPSISFEGMVDNRQKSYFMNRSKGLLFPVLWNEPFGLALIESLYFGCPVFGTPYGSLPELIHKDIGVVSASSTELAEAMANADQFSRKTCHEYARDVHNSKNMTIEYIKLFEKVMNGENVNKKQPQLREAQTEKYLPFS